MLNLRRPESFKGTQSRFLRMRKSLIFGQGSQEIKDAGIDIELSQIRLHRPQSTLALH